MWETGKLKIEKFHLSFLLGVPNKVPRRGEEGPGRSRERESVPVPPGR